MTSVPRTAGGATTAAAGTPWRTAWTVRDAAILAAVLLAGATVRVVLLPTEGFRGDLDIFATWTQGIAANGIDHAYDGSLNFPPVMAFAYGALAAIHPAFRSAVDASDAWVRVLLKLPAIVGDAVMVASLVWLFRRAPRWAVLGAAGVALNPAVILVSAWWGQYESLYTASALTAIVLAAEGRVAAGGAAIALSVMTKPQALPFLVPYGAWVGSRRGLRRLAGAAAAGALVIVALWLPFLAAGGPSRFLDTLRSFQDGPYAVVAINAWNLWGMVQGHVEPGGLAIPDSAALAGPLSARVIGLTLAGIAMLAVVVGIARRPSRAALVVAMTASVLVSFGFLTTMHERYLFPATVLPLALVWWRPARWAVIALSAIFFAEILWKLQATAPFVGAGPDLDVLRVPAAAFVVVAAIASVAVVVLGRGPEDADWDRAIGLGGDPTDAAREAASLAET